jgi:hypothetical protein
LFAPRERAEGLARSGVDRLLAADGETSGAVVGRLKIPGFRVGQHIGSGAPVWHQGWRDKGRCDAACLEIRQFQRFGILLRCASPDALNPSYQIKLSRLRKPALTSSLINFVP